MQSAFIVPALLAAAFGISCDAGRTSVPSNDKTGSGGARLPPIGDAGAGNVTASPGAGGAPPSSPGGYRVSGNTIYDASGSPHLFHGVARPSLEWSEHGESLSPSDYQNMASWGANVARIALNQTFWLGSSGYPETIDQQITWAGDAGLDVILDLHWSDRGDGSKAAQQRMADQHSKTFWQEVGVRYKNDGRVQFELYNEPHDISWEVWLKGGPSGDGFTVVGMQELYDAVRGAGAENVVIIGGIDFAYDLRGVPSHRVKGYNIVYATHPYDYPNKQRANWPSGWGFLAATDPVIVTEFGATSGTCGTGYYSSLIDYADSLHVSWTGWAWYVADCKFPALLVNWNGDPSPPGAVIKAALQSY
jgi:endoglucanase